MEQITAGIRPEQLAKVKAILADQQREDPNRSLADVLRQLIDLGLHRYRHHGAKR